MPCISEEHATLAVQSVSEPDAGVHRDRHSTKNGRHGAGSHQHHTADMFRVVISFGMVHTLVPIETALTIPAGKAAVDKEWNKLQNLPTWDFAKVRAKEDVIREARSRPGLVHFASRGASWRRGQRRFRFSHRLHGARHFRISNGTLVRMKDVRSQTFPGFLEVVVQH